MFELLDEKTVKPRRWTFVLGMVLIASLIGLTMLAPVLFPQTLSRLTVLAQESLRAPAPIPAAAPQAVKPPKVKPPAKKFTLLDTKLHAPPAVPEKPNYMVDQQPEPQTNIQFCNNCVVGGVPSGRKEVVGDLVLPEPALEPPPTQIAEAPVKPPDKTIVVGGRVQAANLLSRVVPAYPALAKQVRQEGTVKFAAIVAVDGSIKDLRLISGPPLLVAAAMDAVRQWRYRPTLLNGIPVEVITQIDVNFTLAR